jgi:AcrR family transcriptional regulator
MKDMPRKRRTYHHGDLRSALVREAARTIREEGVNGVTLRDVGKRLGVSRTALYRHFADKSALFAAIAREGFQAFARDLRNAWQTAGGGRTGLSAMGAAYVRFAVENPAHYRIMFGGFKHLSDSDAALRGDAAASFHVLVDAIASMQSAGVIRGDDRMALGHFIWATVHGIAMLAIDGQLGPDAAASEALTTFALERLMTGVALPSQRTSRTLNQG